MTCKDCRHYGTVCSGYTPTDMDSDKTLNYCATGKGDEIPYTESICQEFDCYRHNPDYPPEHCFTVRECEECGELYEPFCEFEHICKLQNSYSTGKEWKS